MQARGRKNPTKPAVPGSPVLQEFEYVRNGTRVLYGGLDVATGETTVQSAQTASVSYPTFWDDLGSLGEGA